MSTPPRSGDRSGRWVIVWDAGTYRNETIDDAGVEVDCASAIADGHVRVWLSGEKLRGGWALTQAHLGGDEDNWSGCWRPTQAPLP